VSHGKRAWQTKESGPLPLSLTWGCKQLKMPGLPLCSENKRKRRGSFGSVLQGNRAWQRKELVRKEPYAKVHMTIFAAGPSLQELVSLELRRFAWGVICTKIMMAEPTAGQFPLICCT